MNYTLGIDTGTTSVSIAALSEAREILDSITANHDAFIPGGTPESRIQSPAKILSIVMAGVESLTQKFGKPSAIGLTGQMHGILYVDSRGEAVSPLYTWQDSTGNDSLPILRAHGLKVSPGYGMSTHFSLQRAGKIPGGAKKFTTISDYIAMKLCGNNSPVLSAEMAAGLGCFDVKERRFAVDGLKSAGVDVSYIPETVKGYSIVGETESGVPVLCSMGDNQASFMGSVDDETNTLLLNVGTGSQVSFMTREFADVSGDIELRPYGEKYLLAGSALCGGRAYAMLEAFYREITGQSCYDMMNEHAGKFLEAHGLSHAWDVDTRFNGTRSNPNITGSIRGIVPENFTPGAFTVGVMRGIIGELHGMYEEMTRLTCRKAAVIVGSGNGLRRNEIMQRIAGEIFGLEVRIPEGREEAAKGAAMCAAVAVRL